MPKVDVMTKIFGADEVAKHNRPESCWLILYGKVYNVSSPPLLLHSPPPFSLTPSRVSLAEKPPRDQVTDFLPHHPGGSKIIVRLSGKDATEEYDPIHPPGTLEENLPPHALLGQIDSSTLPQHGTPKLVEQAPETPPSMEDVLNLDEMEEIATKQISNKGWAYYYSAGDDLLSKRLNTEAYRSILLRPRIFVDCEQCDISTNFLGHRVGMPIFVSPAAMARLAHPSGEVGIAKACSRFGTMQLISNNASMTPEQIVADAPEGQIFGWQIYVQLNRKKSEDMLARINRLSHRIKLICLTLDAPVPGKREHDERQQNVASNLPVSSALKASSDSTPMKGGVGRTLFQGTSPKLTWAKTIPWLAKHTLLPIILKGIQTHEDAYLASLYSPQVRGIVLSNHGGRALDTAPPAVHTLLEIRKYCPEVFDKLQVFVDGGIKRGTDVVKALALGASGVGIGRAALWGLGAGGQAGVERTLEILSDELKTAMRLLGAQTLQELSPKHVNTRAVEQQIYDGPAGLEKPRMLISWKL